MTVSAELAEIHQWWAQRSGLTSRPTAFRIAGSAYDQVTPTGVDNPYWEIVRQLPAVREAGRACPDGFARGLPVGHHLLTKRYSWAIPSPGDITWLIRILHGRGLVEIGAGSGYWAWQAAQAGIDVVAYEPVSPSANGYTDGTEYFAVRRDGPAAARHHPDRALLLCWPSHDDSWATDALRAYTSDLLIYIGQGAGGHCADDGFFQLLARAWTPIASSGHHVTWRHTPSTMTAYRRGTGPRPR
ncbi:hypothetical protein NE235_14790 [Actinoallomurus spadix]|uniref:Uncharacterized protein n=1 Tax=Actinoallomurus spadix TaxID=79912 RepID=A0ABN0WFC5_9ACTN|nr:hypothetical protein [Actinoallomurus spadix]MCO5987371.1 hypothetical protein [Actinoallomurus spadix]